LLLSRQLHHFLLLTTENIMENQHQKIAGYRDLTQTEIDLMNEAKALAEQCGAFVLKLRQHPDSMRTNAPNAMGEPPLDQRWVSIGATDLQRGFMAVIRGIAQPTTF
jgi:hypothetical protein